MIDENTCVINKIIYNSYYYQDLKTKKVI